MRLIERIGDEMRRRDARSARLGGGGLNRHAGGEENTVILVERLPLGGPIGTQRKVHAIGDVLIIRLFTAGSFARVAQQFVGTRHRETPYDSTFLYNVVYYTRNYIVVQINVIRKEGEK